MNVFLKVVWKVITAEQIPDVITHREVMSVTVFLAIKKLTGRY